MAVWYDRLRGVFVAISGALVGDRRVATLNIIPGTGLEVTSDFDEHTGAVDLTIAASGTTFDNEFSASDRLLGRDTAGAGAAEEITVGGGLEFTGSQAIQRSALTGAITAAAGSNVTALGNNVVTLDNLDTDVTDAIAAGGEETPVDASLTTGQNDWAPTGFATGRYIRVDSDDDANTVTGFSSDDLAPSRKTLVNAGSNDFVVAHESASSTAQNRVITPTGADYIVSAGISVEMFYDSLENRWRLVETPAVIAPLSRVLFVDSGSTVTPADGSIKAPFTTLQDAHDAATANSTVVVIACSTGAALSVTKNISILPWRALIERPFAGYARAGENAAVGAVTVAAGVVLTVSGMNTSSFALPSGGTLNLGQGCDVNGAITGTGDIRISRADLHADITGSAVTIANSLVNTGVDISVSGTSVSLESVWFAGTVSIVFTGSAGTVQMDPFTHEKWLAATETLTNGSIVVFGAAAAAAPTDAQYLVGAGSSGLSDERVVTNTTTVEWTLTSTTAEANVPDASLVRGKLANGSACSVIGRVSNSSGTVQDIQAGANDRVLARSSDVVGFVQVTGGMIQSGEVGSTHLAADAVTNTVLRNSGACSVIGRSANSSGDPADISAATNDRVFCRTGDALQFAQVTGAMIATNTVALGNLAQVGTDSLLGRDTAGTGNVEEIALGSSLAFNGTGALVRAALTGDVTASVGSNTTTIANDAVTNAKAANMAESTIKGRAVGAGTGDPTDLTPAQARTVLGMLDIQTFTANGTWEMPTGATLVEFLIVGGGGGGGAESGGVGGGGGGAGAIKRVLLPASFIPTTNDLSISIGAAGAAGSAGGPTTISDSLQFGLSASGGSAGTAGGAGGAAGAEGLNSGASGGDGHASNGLDGASSGHAGIPGSGGANAPGGGGTGYGSGGGGGATASDGGGGGAGGYGDGTTGGAKEAADGTSTVGGAGASGLVIITTWRG